jgi:hypothetical protein
LFCFFTNNLFFLYIKCINFRKIHHFLEPFITLNAVEKMYNRFINLYERLVGTLIFSSWISTLKINDFNFILPSRIQDFSFMNSRFLLRKFTISTSWINFQVTFWTLRKHNLHEYTISTLQILARKFMKLKSWIHEFEIVKKCLSDVEIVNL